MKAAQHIQCEPWPEHPCAGDSFVITAKSTSGLPVHTSVLAGPANIAENRVTFLRPGEVKIKVRQDGNDEFEAAPDVVVTFTVTKAKQTIQIDPLPGEIFSGDRIVIKATASSQSLVVFRVLTGPAELSGGRVAIITGIGQVDIEAHQAGNDKFLPAKATVSFTATKRRQEIVFTDIQDGRFEDRGFAFKATSTSGLPVRLSLISGQAKIQDNEMILTGAGPVVVKASQAGDICYSAAEVERTFKASRRRQTIDFAAPGALRVGETCTLRASASSGLPVTFSVAAGQATVVNDHLTARATGSVTIKATQAGNDNYEPAETVQNLAVSRARQELKFKPLPTEVFVGSRCTLEASASSGLTNITFSLVSGKATLSGDQVELKGVGMVVIRTTQAGNENFESAQAEQSLLVLKAKQTINLVGTRREASAGESLPVSATADSGLPVSIVVLSGPAEIVEGRLTVRGAGEVKIKATQSGDENYEPAPEVVHTLTAVKARQTIQFDLTREELQVGESIVLTAQASSGQPVTFRVVSGQAELKDNTLVGTGAGRVEIEAGQPGDGQYLPVKIQRSLLVSKRSQEIHLGQLPDRQVGEPPFVINAAASSGLPVSFSVLSGPAQIKNNEVTLTGAGRVMIKATQPGDRTHAAAEAECSFSIGKGRQTITFEEVAGGVTVGETRVLQAGASSGLPVTFSVVQGKASLKGNQFIPEAAGDVTIKACQTGNDNYEPAEAMQSLRVVKALQRLEFKALPTELSVGDRCILNAVASSGLTAVTFNVVSGKATISGHELIPSGAGSIVLKAAQAGNERFEPAEAKQAIQVIKAKQSIKFDGIPHETCAGESFPVKATAGSGLPVSISVLSGPAEIVDGQLTVLGAGEVKLKATQSGDENYGPAPEVVHALTAGKARQTIQFDLTQEELQIGESIPLTAQASSGQPVTFRVVSGQVELKGNTLVGIGVGRAEIVAEHQGDGKYLPAKTQRSLLVKKRPQEIVLEQVQSRRVDEPPFVINAEASSGLPVSFSVLSGPAQIKNNEVTLCGAGRVILKVSQAGDSTYAATETECSFSVGKGRQTIAFEPVTGVINVGEVCVLQARASSGLPVDFSVVAGRATLVGGRLTPEAAGGVTIKASQTGNDNYEPIEAVQSLTVAKALQGLEFKALPTGLCVGDRCSLNAVASSGLTPVTFRLVSGKATISGHELTLMGAGSVVLKAAQAGNERFEPAEAEQSLLVLKAKQTISFDGLPREACAGESFPVRATTDSGLPASIVVVSGPAEIIDGQLTVHGAGEVKFKATQSGNEHYGPAPEAVHTLSVVKARQTIQFELTREELQIGESIALAAQASSGQPVTFRVVSGPAELKGNTLVGTGAGRVEIEAEQLGDGKYLSAKTQRSFLINKRSQEIHFEPVQDKRFGEAPFLINATASSGLPVTLNVVTGPAQTKSNEVTLTGAGRVVLKAAQTGNSTYAAAEKECAFLVGKGRQTIDFEAVAEVINVAKVCLLQARASSGLTVSFSVLAGKASLAGNRLMPEAAGLLIIKASQSGTDDYEPAEAEQRLTVVKARQTLDFKALPREVIVGDRCTLEALTSSGLTEVIFSVASGTARITDQQLTLLGVGLVVIKALQPGNEKFEAAEAEQSLQVLKAKQSISFEGIPQEACAGESFPLRATASSGLPASISVASGPAEIVQGQLLVHHAGDVKIRAAQSGDENYSPAPEVVHTLRVIKARQTIQFELTCEQLQIGESIALIAQASSGLPVTFRVVSGPAELEGNTLVGTGAGRVEIEAGQAGDGKYLPVKTQRALLVKKRSQEILFAEVPDSRVEDRGFTFRAASTSGLPVRLGLVSGQAKIEDNEVTLTGAGQVEIKAEQAGDNNYLPAEVVQSFSGQKRRQTIQFDAALGQARVGETCTLRASASSGLPVTFNVVTGPASLVGDRLTPSATGSLTIKATQTGNDDYEPVEAVQTLTVVKSQQRLDFKTLPREVFVGDRCALEAIASSGLTDVTFSLVSGKATISGHQLTLNGAGPLVLKAFQAGNESFEAVEAQRSIDVLKAKQTIRFEGLPSQFCAGDSLQLQAKADSRLPVSIVILSGPAKIMDGRLTVHGAGEVKIQATQPGDENHAPAAEVHTLTAVKALQTIRFDLTREELQIGESIELTAQASSGQPVGFRVVSGSAELKGDTLVGTSAGRVEVEAEQPGDDKYLPAKTQRSLLVNKRSQEVLRFEATPARLSAGETCTLQASASSGLPVSFSVVAGRANLVGKRLTPEAAGSLTIKATQAGNDDYQPAEAVQSLTVLKAKQTLEFTTLPKEASIGDCCSLAAVASSGLTDIAFRLVSGKGTISGHQLRLSGAGRVVVRAVQAGNEKYEAAEAEQSVAVLKSKQTICFDALPREISAGESCPVRATADSGLPVSIDVVSGPAELVNSQLTLLGAGEVKIKATQAGDENYAPAPDTIHTLTVVRARQTIVFELPHGNFQAGDSILLTATASSGLPVTFRLLSGPAELYSDSLVGTGAGRVEVEAEQIGDENYLPAKAKRSLVVVKRTQEILFEKPGDRKVGESGVTLGATANSGLPVTFRVASGPASINGSELILSGPGKVRIIASQSGDDAHEPAPEVEREFNAKAPGRKTPAIMLGAIATVLISILGVFLLWPSRQPAPTPKLSQAQPKAQELSDTTLKPQTDDVAFAQSISNTVVSMREGRLEDARHMVGQALLQKPGDPAALALKAQIDAEIKDASELKEFQQLAQQAQKAESDGQWSQAVELLKQALVRAGKLRDAKYGQTLISELNYATSMDAAQTALSQGNYVEAINQSDGALAVKSKDALASKVKADAQIGKHYQEAMKAAQDALDKGDYTETTNQLEVALRVKPKDPEATKLRLLAQQGQTYQAATAAFRQGDYVTALTQSQQFKGTARFDQLSAQIGQEQSQFKAMQRAFGEGNYADVLGNPSPSKPAFDTIKAAAAQEDQALKQAHQKLASGDYGYIATLQQKSYGTKPPFVAILDEGRKAQEKLKSLQKTNAVPGTVPASTPATVLAIAKNDSLVEYWEIYFGLRPRPAGSEIKPVRDPTKDSAYNLEQFDKVEADYATLGALSAERKHRIDALRWLVSAGKKGKAP